MWHVLPVSTRISTRIGSAFIRTVGISALVVGAILRIARPRLGTRYARFAIARCAVLTGGRDARGRVYALGRRTILADYRFGAPTLHSFGRGRVTRQKGFMSMPLGEKGERWSWPRTRRLARWL